MVPQLTCSLCFWPKGEIHCFRVLSCFPFLGSFLAIFIVYFWRCLFLQGSVFLGFTAWRECGPTVVWLLPLCFSGLKCVARPTAAQPLLPRCQVLRAEGWGPFLCSVWEPSRHVACSLSLSPPDHIPSVALRVHCCRLKKKMSNWRVVS